MKNAKLELRKLEVTKLRNPESISGGNGGGGQTATDKEIKKSGLRCLLKK